MSMFTRVTCLLLSLLLGGISVLTVLSAVVTEPSLLPYGLAGVFGAAVLLSLSTIIDILERPK